MACVEDRRDIDIVPYDWITEFLNMYKIPGNITDFITKAMKKLKVKLAVGRKTLATDKLQRGIAHGFIELQILQIITYDTGIEFEIEKCTMLKKRRKERKRNDERKRTTTKENLT